VSSNKYITSKNIKRFTLPAKVDRPQSFPKYSSSQPESFWGSKNGRRWRRVFLIFLLTALLLSLFFYLSALNTTPLPT